MTLQPFSQFMTLDMHRHSFGFSNVTIDASGEKTGWVVQIPKDGTITHIGFRTGTVFDSETLKVGLYTLSGGNPSTTAYGGMAVGTQASPASNTFYEVALGTSATATAGDFVAIMIEFNSSIGNVQISSSEQYTDIQFPWRASFIGGSWVRETQGPMAVLKYSDGTYPDFFNMPYSALTEVNYGTSSSPDERALKFKLPFETKIRGVQMRKAITATANFDIILYDSDGTTALSTISVDDANLRSTNSRPIMFIFPDEVTIKRDTFYRLSLKPTTVSPVWLLQGTVNSNAMLDSMPGGRDWYLSTRTNAGAWTDTTTIRPHIGPVFSAFHDGRRVFIAS